MSGRAGDGEQRAKCVIMPAESAGDRAIILHAGQDRPRAREGETTRCRAQGYTAVHTYTRRIFDDFLRSRCALRPGLGVNIVSETVISFESINYIE